MRHFIGIVCTVGVPLLVVLVWRGDWVTASHDSLFWWMLLFAIAGELAPLRVPFRGDYQQVTLSTSFVFVLLLRHGIGVAVGAQVVDVLRILEEDAGV